MTTRTKVLIAIFTGVALLGAIWIAMPLGSRAGPDAISGTSPQTGASATDEAPLQRATTGSVNQRAQENTSKAPAREPTPPPATAAREVVAAAEPRAIEANAAPPTEPPPVASNPGSKRRPQVAAECWGLRGSAPRDYSVTLDREIRTSGEASALVSSLRDTHGYTTMFQTSSAAAVRGKRVEFSADLRTRGAKGGAFLLLRAEDAYGNPVAFDNMHMSYGEDRLSGQPVSTGIKADTEWSTERVVVDIPENAAVITYGLTMEGTGKVWIDHARLEVVASDVATTGIPVGQPPNIPHNIPVNQASLNRQPRNLDFDREAQSGAVPCN